MNAKKRDKYKFVLDLEMLNKYNSEGCAACGGKFTLGETVVIACGPWGSTPKVIHENEAVYDHNTASYVEKGCFKEGKY